MCTDKLKLRNDLTLDEINLLLAEEKNINVYRKLEYFKFKAMGFSKNESCELAGLKESSKYYLEKLWYLGGYNALVPHYGGGRDPKLGAVNKLGFFFKFVLDNLFWLIYD